MNIQFWIGRIIRWLGRREYLNFLNDSVYLKLVYFFYMGEKLDLENPVTLNQKIQWLKLHDRNNDYSKLVDKYEVKNLVADVIGSEYVIPTLGVWNSFNEIDINMLPNQFVLKCTHDSGSCVVCKNKSVFDAKKANEKIEWSLRKNFYWLGREWVYKNIKPRVIAEVYLEDNSDDSLVDYKFYCFGGHVDCVMLCLDRGSKKTKFYFFDRDWNLKRYNKMGMNADKNFSLPKPPNIDEMFNIAEKLSKAVGAPFLRVDLYNVNGNIYFGELTFYPDCGWDRNRLPETDVYFGNLVKLKCR